MSEKPADVSSTCVDSPRPKTALSQKIPVTTTEPSASAATAVPASA